MGRTARALLLLALLTLPGPRSGVRAATLDFDGTLDVAIPAHTELRFGGVGVAGVNGAGALGHLDSLTVTSAGVSGSATTTANTFTAPPTLQSVGVTAGLGLGTLASVSGGPIGVSELPVPGQLRLCIILPGCVSAISVPLTEGGTRGVGLGGIVTVSGFAKDVVHVSLTAAPWTLGAALVSFTTPSGASATTQRSGFAHGPGSATSSSTGRAAAALQLVSAVHVATDNPALASLPGFATLTLRFVPEPGPLVLLAAGGAGLLALARLRRAQGSAR